MPKKFNDPAGKPFSFPQQLLNQISECTRGGYILFFINSEGRIDVRGDFDDDAAEEAVRSYSARWLNSLNSSIEIQETQGMLGMDGEDFDEDDE